MEKRLNSVFKRMMKCCPLEVAAYGACVSTLGDAIDKGACEKQFAALKKCARMVRASKK